MPAVKSAARCARGRARAGLGVGAKVAAVGERRMTLLGSTVLQAHEVNRIVLV